MPEQATPYRKQNIAGKGSGKSRRSIANSWVVGYLTRRTIPKLRLYGFSLVSMNWPGAPGKNPGG
jgi:hypothetical protein